MFRSNYRFTVELKRLHLAFVDGQVNTIDLAAKVDREPRMHITADLSSEKFSLHLTQWRVELYGLPCFSDIRDANLL